METPIASFITEYAKAGKARLHMPGHKGSPVLGPENLDITEVSGADALYEADGIIARSEENATKLFGTGRTVYSTEGSTQCVKAMLFLAALKSGAKRPLFVAARNVHKAFVFGAAFLDARVKWIYPGKDEGLCGCRVTPKKLEEVLSGLKEKPAGVYITSPDYLGGTADISGLSKVCRRFGTLLLVDNAHGAYLHFLEKPEHPVDLGADICCDSAHKTLPVLTGGAYLHVSKTADKSLREQMKYALAAFGSTSPSYLTLASLDLCNQYLEEQAKKELKEAIKNVNNLKKAFKEQGWKVSDSDPLKVTIDLRGLEKHRLEVEKRLSKAQFEPEMYDREHLVLMFTGKNEDRDFEAVLSDLGKAPEYGSFSAQGLKPARRKMSIRSAVLAKKETVKAKEAAGRICAAPTVSCPPAVPVAVPGELITENTVSLMLAYGIEKIECVI